MKNLNPGSENGRRNGVVGMRLKPERLPQTISIKVSYGPDEFEVAVASNSSFGDLKSVIAQIIDMKPETHKLLFRGKEKEDDEFLETAGVKDNSKVLLVDDTTCEQEIPEEVMEAPVVPSKGGEAVAKVKEEVDKLSEQISALQAVVNSGTKVDDKNIVFLTEMLMRQLLKLDGIEAEGEGKLQRRMEVRRVQSLVEIMDLLKSRNLNLSSNVEITKPVGGSSNGSTPVPPSTPSPPPNSTHAPAPSPYSAPPPAPSPYSAPPPAPSPYSAPNPVHPSASPSYTPSYAPYLHDMSSYAPSHYDAPSPYEANYSPNPYAQAHYGQAPYGQAPFAQAHYGQAHYGQAPYAHPNPYPPQPSPTTPYDSSYYPPPQMPSHDPSSMPSYDNSAARSYAPSPAPPSTKVTQDWERFE